jgi:hypothetical protein
MLAVTKNPWITQAESPDKNCDQRMSATERDRDVKDFETSLKATAELWTARTRSAFRPTVFPSHTTDICAASHLVH